jgi:hypothetical protein
MLEPPHWLWYVVALEVYLGTAGGFAEFSVHPGLKGPLVL